MSCCNNLGSSKFKDVTHVIFDMDGTILDTEQIYGDTIRRIIEAEDKVYTPELLHKICGTNESTTINIVIKELNLTITHDEFLQKFRQESDPLISAAPFMPGVERLVHHFHDHKIPLAIATSSPQNSYDLKVRDRPEFFSMFHHYVCGSTDPEVKAGKPAPDIFLVCASRFEDKPEPAKCLVFEDAVNGMKGALAAGMQIVLTPEPSVKYENWKQATMRLDTLENMRPEFFGLPEFPDNSVE